MNLNISLDLNVSEVVSPKGNADRQPLWNDDPVDRDFEQLLQDEIANSDENSAIEATLDPQLNMPAKSRQEVAATEAVVPPPTQVTDTNPDAQTPSDEQAQLLALIANARSYEVSVESNTSLANKLSAEATAALAGDSTAELTTSTSNADVILTAGAKLATSATLIPQQEINPSLETLNEENSATSAKGAISMAVAGTLLAESETSDESKRSAIEKPPIKTSAVASALNLDKLTGSDSAKSAVELDPAANNAANNSTNDALSKNLEKVDAQVVTSQSSTHKTSQEHIAKLVQTASKADASNPLNATEKAVPPEVSTTVGSLTAADTDLLDTEMNRQLGAAATINTADARASNLNIKLSPSAETPEAAAVASSQANANQLGQLGQSQLLKSPHEQVQLAAETGQTPSLTISQLASVDTDIEAGTQAVPTGLIATLNAGGSEQNQSFAEHQKQRNEQQAAQNAKVEITEQLQQTSDENSQQVVSKAGIVDPTANALLTPVKAESTQLLHTTAPAAVSAVSHSAQASSQIAAQQVTLQSEKLANLTANLSLLEPNAASQIKDRLMYQLNNKIQTAEVKITPEDLGSVQIKVNLQQEQLSVQFVVQQANAKELLEQQMPKLKELLQQQGLQLTEGQVEQRHANERRGNGEEKSGHRGYSATAEAEVELAHVATVKKQSDRMVDYYA
jgi:flagellar hook-length control protein FliK